GSHCENANPSGSASTGPGGGSQMSTSSWFRTTSSLGSGCLTTYVTAFSAFSRTQTIRSRVGDSAYESSALQARGEVLDRCQERNGSRQPGTRKPASGYAHGAIAGTRRPRVDSDNMPDDRESRRPEMLDRW